MCHENRLTIPKLEPTAILVGCCLMNHINSIFPICRFSLRSDSKVALSWISSIRELNNVYVANRVAEIQILSISLGINFMYQQQIIQLICFLEAVVLTS